MTQDEDFLPYTTNGLASMALPRQSLDGEINNILANFAVTARPMPKLDLSARYRYDDRDNNTPRNEYFTVGGDAGNQETSPRINLPYSVEQHLVNLDAGYRIMPRTKLSVGYEFEHKDRTFTVVETTRDHTFKGKVQSAPLDYLDGWIQYAHTIRDGSDYVGNAPLLASHPDDDPDDFENHPDLRKYFLTDRSTDDFSAGISVMASEQVTLGLSGGITYNDYDDPRFGLEESTMGHVTVDVGFNPREDMSAYIFLTHERNDFKQDGYSFSPFSFPPIPVDPAGLWSVDTRDRINTVGGRLEWAAIPDKLDVSAEYTFSKALTGFDLEGGSGLQPVLGIPDVESHIHSLGVSADYHLESNMSLKFAYRFEALTTEDFALDGVEANNTRVLGLGESSPDYVAHVFAVSFKYRF
jgi:MtrB/PioB family decaheme-associated outer membrane protein